MLTVPVNWPSSYVCLYNCDNRFEAAKFKDRKPLLELGGIFFLRRLQITNNSVFDDFLFVLGKGFREESFVHSVLHEKFSVEMEDGNIVAILGEIVSVFWLVDVDFL